ARTRRGGRTLEAVGRSLRARDADALEEEGANRGIAPLQRFGRITQHPRGYHFAERAEPDAAGDRCVDGGDCPLAYGRVEALLNELSEGISDRAHPLVELAPGLRRFDEKQPRERAMGAERLQHDRERDVRLADRV